MKSHGSAHLHVPSAVSTVAMARVAGRVRDPTAGTIPAAGDSPAPAPLQQPLEAAAKFLPQVEAISESATDPTGRPLPPCMHHAEGGVSAGLVQPG